ncbi:MAG: recombination mediator RecR [Pseudomonadota bacterium]
MSAYPPTLLRLIKHFARLPGVGEKTATRLALYVMRMSRHNAMEFAQSITAVKDNIRLCSVCFGLTDTDPCAICTDPNRKNGVVCAVEETDDLMAIETSGAYKGRYHVLHGALSPMDGIGPDSLKINELVHRIKSENIQEIILANNTDVEGDATASYLAKILLPLGVKVSRIASGVPVGCELKYIDQVTLKRSVEGRQGLFG